jgi:putative membrane protein
MMGGLSGTAFDRQYVTQQIAEHEVTLALLRGEARSGQDRDVRAFAERHVPVIERHLARLRELETQTVSAR